MTRAEIEEMVVLLDRDNCGDPTQKLTEQQADRLIDLLERRLLEMERAMKKRRMAEYDSQSS